MSTSRRVTIYIVAAGVRPRHHTERHMVDRRYPRPHMMYVPPEFQDDLPDDDCDDDDDCDPDDFDDEDDDSDIFDDDDFDDDDSDSDSDDYDSDSDDCDESYGTGYSMGYDDRLAAQGGSERASATSPVPDVLAVVCVTALAVVVGLAIEDASESSLVLAAIGIVAGWLVGWLVARSTR